MPAVSRNYVHEAKPAVCDHWSAGPRSTLVKKATGLVKTATFDPRPRMRTFASSDLQSLDGHSRLCGIKGMKDELERRCPCTICLECKGTQTIRQGAQNSECQLCQGVNRQVPLHAQRRKVWLDGVGAGDAGSAQQGSEAFAEGTSSGRRGRAAVTHVNAMPDPQPPKVYDLLGQEVTDYRYLAAMVDIAGFKSATKNLRACEAEIKRLASSEGGAFLYLMDFA
jgi:hypothetical protein